MRYAGVSMRLVFQAGLAALLFLPETKGQPTGDAKGGAGEGPAESGPLQPSTWTYSRRGEVVSGRKAGVVDERR